MRAALSAAVHWHGGYGGCRCRLGWKEEGKGVLLVPVLWRTVHGWRGHGLLQWRPAAVLVGVVDSCTESDDGALRQHHGSEGSSMEVTGRAGVHQRLVAGVLPPRRRSGPIQGQGPSRPESEGGAR